MTTEQIIQLLTFVSMELAQSMGESPTEIAKETTLREALMFYAGQKSTPLAEQLEAGETDLGMASEVDAQRLAQMVNA